MVNLKKVVALLVMVALVITAAACAPAPVEKEDIKIGFIGLLTGAGAVCGRPVLDGSRLAVDEINAAGGVLGQKLVLISRDTGGRPEEAVRLARELILREEVQFIQGPFTDAENMAVSQVGKELKTIVLPYDPVTYRLVAPENLHPYIFHGNLNTIYEAGYVALYIAEHKEWKTIYTIAPDYEYGQMQTESLVNWINKLRPDMQFIHDFPPLFETDYTAYITKIAETEPDVLYVAQWGGDFIALMKQAAEFKMFDKVKFVITVGGNAAPEFGIPLGEDYPEGVLANGRDLCYWPDTPEHNAYIEGLQNLIGDPYPSGFCIQGYIGITLLAGAIEKAGTTETEAVIEALEGLTVDTPIGKLTMGEDHQLQRGTTWGFTKRTPDYPFVILDQIRFVPWDEVMQHWQ